MATKPKIQPDYGDAFDVFYEQLQRQTEQYKIPVIENGLFTGKFTDSRLPQQEGQPQPRRLQEHIEYLRTQGVQPLVAGQPIPDFNPQDPYQSEGLLDSFGNILKLAYNRSLTADVQKIAGLGEGFDVEQFQPNKVEDIAASVLSFFSPLDLVTLAAGGGVGGLAVKGIAKKAIAKAVAKGLTQEAAEKAVAKTLIQVIPRSAGSLGAYEAAREGVTNKIETGELKLEPFLEGLVKGGTLGALIGPAGKVGGLLPKLPAPFRKALDLTGETVALGAGSPFIFEQRAPTLEDFEHAAEFIVGLKLAGGTARAASSGFRRLRDRNRVEAESDVNQELNSLIKESRDVDFNEAVQNRLLVAAGLEPIPKPEGKIITGAEPSGKGLEYLVPGEKEVGKRANDLKVLLNTGEITQSQYEQLSRLQTKRLEAFRAGFQKPVEKPDRPKPVIKLLPEKSGKPETPVFGKGFTSRPESRDKFLRTVGSEQAERQLKAGGVVELTGEKAGRIFGEEALRGKKPANVFLAEGEGGGRVLMHEIFKVRAGGKKRAALNILSVDNMKAFERAWRLAQEQKKPLSMSVELKDTPLFRVLREKGLIGEIKPTDKYVRIKPVEDVVGEVSRETFQKQMTKALPNAKKSQIEATMAIVDARAESAGLTTDQYLKSRFPIKAVLSSKGDPFQLAQTEFFRDGKAVITAFKRADVSSMAHELGHVFRRDLKADDLVVASKWAGAKDPLKWSTVAEEKFAKGFERYLAEGIAPTPKLKAVFERFKDWLTKIYENLTKIGSPEITPEMRSVYDRLLSKKPVAPEGKQAYQIGLKEYLKYNRKPTKGTNLYGDIEKPLMPVGTKAKIGGVGYELFSEKHQKFGQEITTIQAKTTIAKDRFGDPITKYIPANEWHKGVISQAIAEGKSVPPEVLKDYPDLAKRVAPEGKITKSEIPTKMDDITKTLFQTRMTAKEMGKEVLDRYEKTAKLLSGVRSLEKRVKRVESKSLLKMMAEDTYLDAQYARKNMERGIELGFLNIKTKAEADKISESIKAGKAPGWAQLFKDLFKEITGVGVKIKERENYLPGIIKREYMQDLVQGLQALRLRLGDVAELTEMKIRTAINAAPAIVKDNLNHILETKQIESAKKALAGIKLDVNKRALDYLVDTQKFETIIDALKAMERDSKGSFTTEPFWTKPKRLDLLPEAYETDFRRIFSLYADSHAKKRAQMEAFGGADGKALKLLAQLEKIDPEEGRLMREGLSKHTGLYELEHGLKGFTREAADAMMNFEVITKIASGFAPLLNTSQAFISVYQLTGAMNMLKAGLRLLDPVERAKVRESGIYVGSSATEAYLASIGFEGGGRFRKWSDFATKWSGFNSINRFNNYLAAASIEEALPAWIKKAQGVGKRAVGHRRTLAELGVNYQKPLTDEIMKRVMFNFAENSQLFKNIAKEPLFLNDPRLRPLLLFKRFGIRQAGYIKDILIKETKRGNYMPILRTVAAGYLGGAAMIWAQNQIKSLLSGEEFYRPDDDFVTQFMENISVIGMFGLMGDMLRVDRASSLPRNIKFGLTPVVISDVEKLFESFTSYMKDWETYGDGWLATKRNTYRVFDIFGSLPRYAARQLKTPGQVERALSYRKGLEKREIFGILLDGNGEQAGKRTAQWNKANPSNPITMDEVNLREIIKHLERLAETKSGAAGKKDSPEFKLALRKEKQKVREKVKRSITREDIRRLREHFRPTQ